MNEAWLSATSADNSVFIVRFDPAGTVTSWHRLYAWTPSGDVIRAEHHTFEHDGAGRLLKEFHESIDLRSTSVPQRHVLRETEHAYDADGRLVTETVREDDLLQGGSRLVEVVTFTYDSLGRVASEDRDAGGDGLLDSPDDQLFEYLYDFSGNPLLTTLTHVDGYVVTLHAHDFNNRKTEDRIYRSLPDFAIGKESAITSYSYDAEGRLTRVDEDSLDANRQPIPDGVADRITTYAYGDAGELTEIALHGPYRGTTARGQWWYVHDVSDTNGDGLPDASASYRNYVGVDYDDGTGYPPDPMPGWLMDYEDHRASGAGPGRDWSGFVCLPCDTMIATANRTLMDR